MGSKTILHRGG